MMFLSLRSASAALAAAGLALSSAAAGAITWVEQPPGAGDLVPTAQITRDGALSSLDAITGALTTSTPVGGLPERQVDLYKIFVSNFATFSATTVSSLPEDTALFLFDQSGHGIYTNDDFGTGFLSQLPSGFLDSNGYYYIGVAAGGYTALDGSSGNIFNAGSFNDVLGAVPTAGSLASWTTAFPSFDEGALDYRIEFTGATVAAVPEPGTLLLLLGGIAVLAARRPAARAQPV